MRVGAALRAIRKRRGWRQVDVAAKAGVSSSFVSLCERGHLDLASIRMLRRMASALDVRLDLQPRWRGSEPTGSSTRATRSCMRRSHALRRASGLGVRARSRSRSMASADHRHPRVARRHAEPAGDRAQDPDRRCPGAGRRCRPETRLAKQVARERGWDAATVSSWVIVVRSATNQRRVAAHRTMLRTALPTDGRTCAPGC